jgi:hypothetical protein
MLEVGGTLWTWRLDATPHPGSACGAIRIADHRPLYLDYEGAVGGDRGTVERVAEGVYSWLENSPDRIVVELRGDALSGRLTVEGGRAILDPLV